jgi:CRISPR-associated protein Csb3
LDRQCTTLCVRGGHIMSIRINVDPTNPGQFFACCGLLELADRQWNGAEGWFVDGEFCVSSTTPNKEATADSVLRAIRDCCLANTMTEDQVARLEVLSAMKGRERDKTPGLDDEKKALKKLWREQPILLGHPFNMRIDWFSDNRAGGDRFKTWAGQQSVLDIATAMKQAVGAPDWQSLPPARWLTHTGIGYGLPFNFDADLGGQGSAIDIGFSFDPLAASAATRIESRARPCLELLALVGLQRFRPRPLKHQNGFLYCLWSQPFPPQIASVVACGLLPVRNEMAFAFRLLYRTDYLKSFLPGIPYSGDLND